MKIVRAVVMGAGYVGLVTAAGLAELGHQVMAVEPNTARREALAASQVPFHEPGLQELVARNRAAGRLIPAPAWHPGFPAEVFLIAVGTPARPDGSLDLTQLHAAAKAIRAGLEASPPGEGAGRPLVVLRSTIPPGTTREVARRLAGLAPVAHNPEFLAEGTAVRNFFHPDRVVIGVRDPGDAAPLLALYRPVVEQRFRVVLPEGELVGRGAPVPVRVTSPEEAELIKLGANAMLATRVSFINELARLCDRCGARVSEVTAGIGLDPRIGPAFLRAGVGWGGSCFGKDVQALLAAGTARGIDLTIPAAALGANRSQRRWFANRIAHALGGLQGKALGVLGLAFKPGTDDLRDAPALELIRLFLAGGARVKAHDPVAMARCRAEYPDLPIGYAESPAAAARGAHGLVLVTDWPAYAALDLRALRQEMAAAAGSRPLLADGRNLFDPAAAEAAGFAYLGVGVPGSGEPGTEP
ncbi:MAG: UDP-glucose/GDP-mannose dehydrogenase family protein [Firmicutes bacterium]|nr:UDP-glucose/GDP-mannose dehydrogenase family protein [Bacillota bacterium]